MFTGLGSGPAKGCAAQFLARHLAFGIWLGPWGEGRALGLQNEGRPHLLCPSSLLFFPSSHQAHSGSQANFLKGRSLLLRGVPSCCYLTSYHTLSHVK